MFRTEIFIEDKKLVPFLKAISGLVLSMSPPQMVVNAEARNGKIEAQTDGTVQEMFLAHLNQRKLKHFSVGDIRHWLKSQGRAEGSFGYVVKKLRESKRAKMVARGHYTVNP